MRYSSGNIRAAKGESRGTGRDYDGRFHQASRSVSPVVERIAAAEKTLSYWEGRVEEARVEEPSFVPVYQRYVETFARNLEALRQDSGGVIQPMGGEVTNRPERVERTMYRIEIDTSGPAFRADLDMEMARILAELSLEFENGKMVGLVTMRIRDRHGKQVGQITYQPKQ